MRREKKNRRQKNHYDKEAYDYESSIKEQMWTDCMLEGEKAAEE